MVLATRDHIHLATAIERDLHTVTSNTREDGHALLAEAAEIPLRPHTTVYPLADANQALQDLKHDRISGTGVLVN
jgi:propanol-preferring alcohol dehydrogenase